MSAWSRFSQIKDLLDHEDIEGLLALGAPPDEYDGEASLLESEMAKATSFGETTVSPEQLEEMLARIWNDQFGPFSDDELRKRRSAFAAVAGKLTEL